MTAPGSKIIVDRVETLPAFEKLREEWNDLLEASATESLFLTWEWLYPWWKHLAEERRLSILAARSGGELVALAPFALRPAGLWPFPYLEFLGTGSVGSDYLDLIVRRRKEEAAHQALAACLTRSKVALALTQLHRGHCLAEGLAERLTKQESWKLVETATDICPFIRLSGQTWDSYIASLGSEHRYNFRRRLKNLKQRFDVRFEQALSEDERREALDHLVALHQMRWRERGGSNAFHSRELVSFHEEFSRLALERGWLRLFILRLDGKPAASLYGFRYHRIFYFYQSGFDPSYGKFSVGLVAMGLSIKKAIEEGAEEYDLLHGDESYKFHWARQSRALGRLEIYPPSAHGWLHQGTVSLGRALKRVAKQLLRKTVEQKR